MTCRHSYRKETNLSDIHDFDSSQLSCPLVTALCSTQINRSYFVATMVLIVKQSNLIELLLKWNSHHGWFKERMNVACYFFFLTSKSPHFQNEAKCTNFLVKMSFVCIRMKHHFHIKGWALNHALIQRPGEAQNWPICQLYSGLSTSSMGKLLTLQTMHLWVWV